ncbi:hypothetical protein [Streptomyces sp. NPDC056987]|uniref:hypothetical protein n=1 Tax=Streptomyces sp. NPDC056987 TaxID=3345988 RepID=UPI003638E32F
MTSAFNYPIGTPVFAYPGARPEDIPGAPRLVTRTRTTVRELCGSDVVWVEGEGSCIAVTHLDVVTEQEWEAARTADAVADQGALPVPAGPGQEKTTPAAAAGTAVTPAQASARQAILVALARSLREQPTGAQILDGLDNLGEAVLDEHDAGEIAAWVDGICYLARIPLAGSVTEYLASHESFPVGRYLRKEAAVEHIEDLLVQEEGPEVRSRIVWSDPEDEDEEVPVWDVALRDPATGALIPTQYMVTALSLAHDYDREADA